MAFECLDTNVIVRYLVETPGKTQPRFQGVFAFFSALERGELDVFVPDLVLFQAYFVLTSHYEVPSAVAAEKLRDVLSFKGVHATEPGILSACLGRIQREKMDIVDAYLIEYSRAKRLPGVYTYNADLGKKGMTIREI